MSFSNTSEIRGEYEGLELIESSQSPVPPLRAPEATLLSYKQDWLVTRKHYRDSIYRLVVSSLQLFQRGIALWPNGRIRGIPRWPIMTVSFIVATTLFLLFSAAFRATENLPTPLKIAGILVCVLFISVWLIAWLFIHSLSMPAGAASFCAFPSPLVSHQSHQSRLKTLVSGANMLFCDEWEGSELVKLDIFNWTTSSFWLLIEFGGGIRGFLPFT
jgi:hypothetical protein